MTRYAGPDELISFLGEKNYQGVFQQLAKTECHICKRLFGEHSQEEFNEHALGDAGIELSIAPATNHDLLHFRGHTCTDCEKCEECMNLLDESEKNALRARKDQGFVATDECSECGKLFGEHDHEEIKACTSRIIAKRQTHS